MMPFACAAVSADASWRPIDRIFSTGGRSRRSTAARLSPSTYSITRNGRPSCSTTSWTTAMLGWLMRAAALRLVQDLRAQIAGRRRRDQALQRHLAVQPACRCRGRRGPCRRRRAARARRTGPMRTPGSMSGARLLVRRRDVIERVGDGQDGFEKLFVVLVQVRLDLAAQHGIGAALGDPRLALARRAQQRLRQHPLRLPPDVGVHRDQPCVQAGR